MEPGAVFEFEPFRLAVGERRLWKGPDEVAIQTRPFDVLALLVRESPRVVGRHEFRQEVWKGQQRDPQALDTCIYAIRKLLDPGNKHRYVATVHQEGFRFVAPVRRLGLGAGLCTEREELLQRLRLHLRVHGRATLSGLSGVGTTWLAREYVRRHSGDYTEVFWVPAAAPAVGAAGVPAAHTGPRPGSAIDAGFRELAERLGLAAEMFHADQVRRSVCQWLNTHPGWLLVIDGAASPEEIEDYLPQPAAGHLLVTSTYPDWEHVLAVRHLDPAVSAQFLLAESGRHDVAVARLLAEELGCLPGVLAQAAALVRRSNWELRDFLDELRREVLVLHTDHGRGTPAAVTLRLLLSRIHESCPAGAALMNLTAFFAPQRIPDAAFLRWTDSLPERFGPGAGGSALMFRNALGQLRASSLVDFEERGFSVNRFVQRLAQDALGGHRSEWVQAALSLVHQAFTALSASRRTWDDCAAVLPHALTVAGHAAIHQIEGPQIEPHGLTQHADLWKRITAHLAERGAPLEVHAEMDQVVSWLESVRGTDSPDLAAPLNRFAHVLRDVFEQTGDMTHREKAGEYQRRAVQIGGSQEYRDLDLPPVDSVKDE